MTPTPRHPRVVVALLATAVLAAACTGTPQARPTAPDPQTAEGPPRLRPVDGGPDYYGAFSPGLPVDDSFFPVAVWFESVVDTQDVQADQGAGINTYVELTADSDRSLVADAGMYAIHAEPDTAGTETVGWLLPDEVDMWAGAGDDIWTGDYPGGGDVCDPVDGACGYSVLDQWSGDLPADGRFRYANFGKGVAFWQTDSEAARFINDYTDVVSADTYWFTDENICSPSEGGAMLGATTRLSDDECHLAANYGATVERVRRLVEPTGSRPVWGFVELGHPFSEPGWPTISPAEVRAAVWSSLVHGARGIVYFNHSFGGDCITQHILREDCYADIRSTVTELNATIRDLAPVLNAPFVDGITSVSGPADVATKYVDDKLYLLSTSSSAAGGDVEFQVECAGDGTVTVLGENRTLTMQGGRFEDDFADGNAVHLYELPGAPTCPLA